MTRGDQNRFQDFFEERRYVVLKNHLYNYLLRKFAIERVLARESLGLLLEVGSGISPVMTKTDRIVYSELSVLACRTLRALHGRGWYVVADATKLPFRSGAFSHTISSEVLEHIEQDQQAVQELARVLKPGGRLVLTFPHRKCYFTNDDRYVNHFRRYELDEMTGCLEHFGLHPLQIRKVLGPLEKITMMAAVVVFETLQRLRRAPRRTKPSKLVRVLEPGFKWMNRAYACLAWLDARIVPKCLAAVLLIVAEKR
jgi:SAM-dependent methyltransferase